MKEIIENLEHTETFKLGIKLLCRIFNLKCLDAEWKLDITEALISVDENLEQTKKLSYSEQRALLIDVQYKLSFGKRTKRPCFTVADTTIKLRPYLIIRYHA